MIAAVPQRSAVLRAKLALVRGHHFGARGHVFRSQTMAQPSKDSDISTIFALPDWLLLNADQQAYLAHIIALILHRPAIDQELSGTKLAALSGAVGEDRFDALCDLPLSDEMLAQCSEHLPRPEDLEPIGTEIMRRGIPTTLACHFPGAAGDALSARLCEIAAGLLKEQEGL